MHSFKTEAIVIRRRNFSEKDRILTLFSEKFGKIEAISKGCRRPGSRLCAISDIGTIAKFFIHLTKSIDIIREAESIFIPRKAIGKIDKTKRLSFLFKFVDKSYHEHEAHEVSYKALKNVLQAISNYNGQLQFLFFLAKAIEDLGLHPQLYNCGVCGKKISENESIGFSTQNGVEHLDCSKTELVNISKDEIKLLRYLFALDLNEGGIGKVSPDIYKKVYQLLRLYIEWHFGKIIPEETI